MPARIKSGASTWSLVSKISVKTASNAWSAVQRGYIKVASGWQLFFSGANPPVIVTGPSIRTTNTSGSGTIYDGPLAGSFESLRENLFGKDGTYTNYISTSGRKFSRSSYIDGPRTTIVNDDRFTSASGVTQSDRIDTDDQYLYYELTVSNGGTDIIQPASNPVKLIKEQPSHSVFTVSGGSSTGSVLTINATIANDWYRSAELSTSYIRWYRGTSIGDTSGGNFRTTSLSSAQLTNTSTTYTGQDSYTTTSTDNNKYITIKLFIDNSYTRTIGNNDVDGYQQAVDYTGQIQPALTAPTITSVNSGVSGDPVTVNFTGGSGPAYQMYWTTGSAPTTSVPPDASGTSSPLTDNTGPVGHTFQWYMYVRSVATTGETSVGPSSIASAWSAGFPFTVSAPPVPTGGTITLTGSGATGSTITANQSGWSNSPTGYYTEIRAYTGTPVTQSDVLKASSNSASVSYTITSFDTSFPPFYFRAFGYASNAGGNSSTISSNTILSFPLTPVINSVTASTGGRTGTSPNFNWPNPKITWTASASNASSYRFAWSYSGGASGSGSTTQNSATFALSQPSGTTSSTLHGNMTYSCTITPYSGSGGTGTAGTAYTCATVLNSATPKVSVSV